MISSHVLLVIASVGLVLGTLLHIREEWGPRGLTHKGFFGMLSHIVACLAIIIYLTKSGEVYPAAIVIIPLVFIVACAYLKSRDNWRSKGFKFHRWR